MKSNYKTAIVFIGFSFSVLTPQSAFDGMAAWYHPHNLSMAGAGYSLSSADSDYLNPASLKTPGRMFSVSLIRYPAEIGAESVSLIMPMKNRIISVSLRHLGYGIFEGRDENNVETSDYSSADTWLQMSAAWPSANGRTTWGFSTGLFISNLEFYQALIWSMGLGAVIQLPEQNGRIGFCLRNTGLPLDRYTDARERPPLQAVLSGSRKLAYLPLEICLDAVYLPASDTGQLRIGGVFILPNHFALRMGTTTMKFDQKTSTSITSDFLADTGFGLSYAYAEYFFDLGVYLYGTGGWASGVGFGLKF